MNKEQYLARCNVLLTVLMGTEKDVWWTLPNHAFNLRTPAEVFDTDPQRVYDYLMNIKDGEW